ncbi:hypothetical protein TRFO_37557 [Tritrichomonas foetus]|uniref:Protein kinase domain-containing protein n=1 Tax=Tritrichomonas foetus TaxID=1144522 RepID=A0A1J4JGF2_9EUKA|nr:hypothetical protein TRFO_37557 [Tritrichomonas foetus]|eukprot:OHS96284.1 hypothetical protein TRFO_37557 [Tritrichomonas foetus]
MNSKWEVNVNDFKDLKGRSQEKGGYGIVKFVIQKSTNRKCALKKTTGSLLETEVKRSFTREVDLLSKCQHPAIVPFVGFCEKNNIGHIYLELIENGSLFSCIKKSREGKKDPLWDKTHKFIISYGVCVAMEFLHSMNRIHRDLKPGNILIDSNYYPYVTDFGTSKEINKAIPINQTLSITTPAIMAPEFIENPELYSNSLPIDVYSYGVTLYELWTEIAPFAKYGNNPYKIINVIANGERPNIPDFLDEKWANLIQKCWGANPTSRPTFSKIKETLLQEEFIKDPEIDFKVFQSYKDLVTPDVKIDTVKAPPPTEVKHDYEETPIVKKMKDEADSGKLEAQLDYAIALYKGTYGPTNINGALEYFKKVCSNTKYTKETFHNIALGEYYAGLCYAELEEFKTALTLFKRAVSHGVADAAFTLAELIFDGKIEGKSPEELIMLYQKAADADNIKAINKFALITYYGTISRPNKQLALKYFQKGSDLGDPDMMYLWAIRNEYGRDVEKNIPEAMRLYKLSADLGCSASQLEYGLHLYNGIHVDQNHDLAMYYFELAANQENPEAQLYFSVMLQSTSLEESREYLEKARNGNDPNAWAICGKLFVDADMIDDAIPSLFYGMQHGSITGMLTLGNLCEKHPERGNAADFYEAAANHCHCLDESGFFTPIPYKVFHCKKCNKDICEGCAKHCHKGHSVTEKGVDCGFKCQCGADGFKGQCSGEFVGNEYCNQHLYQCITCCTKTDNEFICKACADKCHAGHNVIDCGRQRNFCSCGMFKLPYNFKCKILDYERVRRDPYICCSSQNHKNSSIKQRWLQCITCGVYGDPSLGLCEPCAYTCHRDHIVIDCGVKQGCCCCYNQCACVYSHFKNCVLLKKVCPTFLCTFRIFYFFLSSFDDEKIC